MKEISKEISKEIPVKTPENFPCALSGRAVPLDFNLSCYRYDLPLACCSDTTRFYAWFYEYHGLYWYSISLHGSKTFNSIPFLSIQGAISAFRRFLSDHDFKFESLGIADARLSHLRTSWKF